MTTLDIPLAADADDAHERQSGADFDATAAAIIANANATEASRFVGGFRFDGVTIAPGSTIDVAYITVVASATNVDDPNVDIHLEDADDPANFTDNADVQSRVRTTANTQWTATGIGTSPVNSPSIVTAVQEVVDRAGWASGQAMVVLVVGRSDANTSFRIAANEHATLAAAALHIEYTAGGGTTFEQAVAGTLTTAGTVVKQTGKPLAGALTSAGAVINQAGKSLAGVLTSSGDVIRSTAKTLAGTLTSAGDVLKQTAKSFAGTLDLSGTVDGIKIALISLAGELGLSGTVSKSIAKSLQGTLTTAGDVIKSTSKLFAGTLETAGSVVKQTAKSFAGTLTSAGELTRQAGKALAGTLTTAGTIVRNMSKSLVGVLSTVGTVTKHTIKSAFAGTLTMAGTVVGSLVDSSVEAIVHLTAKVRSFSLTAKERIFSITAVRRVFNLTVKDRD